MKNKKIACIAVVAVVIMLSGAFFFLNSHQGSPGNLEPVTIGVARFESSALFYIAQDQHFFADNGINVTTRDYETGRASLNDMLNGNVDLSTPSDFVIVGEALASKNISIVATFDKVDFMYIIGRKDRGIANLSDLKGKRIGLARNTAEEFCLGRYFDLHDMNIQDVTMVDMGLAQAVTAIEEGNVDEVVAAQPYVKDIQDSLGTGVISWPAQSSQPFFQVVVGRDDWINEQPDVVVGLLRSLEQAETYMCSHPDDAKAILQRRLNLSADLYGHGLAADTSSRSRWTSRSSSPWKTKGGG